MFHVCTSSTYPRLGRTFRSHIQMKPQMLPCVYEMLAARTPSACCINNEYYVLYVIESTELSSRGLCINRLQRARMVRTAHCHVRRARENNYQQYVFLRTAHFANEKASSTLAAYRLVRIMRTKPRFSRQYACSVPLGTHTAYQIQS